MKLRGAPSAIVVVLVLLGSAACTSAHHLHAAEPAHAPVTSVPAAGTVHTIGDAHLYENHLDQAKLLLERDPRPLPTLVLNPNVRNIDDFTFEDVRIENYDPHPAIKALVAV